MKDLKITIITKGIPYSFEDPECIMIENAGAITFDSKTEDFLQIFSWKKDAEKESLI